MLEINSYEKQLNGLLIEREELFEQINELKNTIERQEIMIDRMKCCHNCLHLEYDASEIDFFSSGETCNVVCDKKLNAWKLKIE